MRELTWHLLNNLHQRVMRLEETTSLRLLDDMKDPQEAAQNLLDSLPERVDGEKRTGRGTISTCGSTGSGNLPGVPDGARVTGAWHSEKYANVVKVTWLLDGSEGLTDISKTDYDRYLEYRSGLSPDATSAPRPGEE